MPSNIYLEALLTKVRRVYAAGDESKHLLPDDGVTSFMSQCHERLGEAYFRTPRTTIAAFINLLSVLDQNKAANWQTLLGQDIVEKDDGGNADHQITSGAAGGEHEFTTFKL